MTEKFGLEDHKAFCVNLSSSDYKDNIELS